MGCSSSTEVRAVSQTFNREQSMTRHNREQEYRSQLHHQNQQVVQQNGHAHSELKVEAKPQQKDPPPGNPSPQYQPQSNVNDEHSSKENPPPRLTMEEEAKSSNVNDELSSPEEPPPHQTLDEEAKSSEHSSPEEPPSDQTKKEDAKSFLSIKAPSQPRNPHSGLAVDMIIYEGLESKIGSSNGILTQEEPEDMKKRLSAYGVYAGSYNARELDGHNNQCGYWDLLIFHKGVISMPALYDLCSPYILAIERTRLLENSSDLPESEYPNYYEQHCFQKPYKGAYIALLHDGLDCRTISLCMKKCQVSVLRTDKNEEAEDQKQDINILIEDISSKAFSQNLGEYKDQLQRACVKFSNGSNVETDDTKSAGDLNQKTFPLPEVFQKNPELIRKWVENWEIFDTTVKQGDGWDFSLKQWELFEKESDEMKIDDTKLHRTELDVLPPFDLSIDGEAGWEVIDMDIIKDDITTLQQEKTWEARQKRTNLNDPVFMEKRRLAIEKYFLSKYEDTWVPKRMEQFRGFTESLVTAEKEFLELCEKS